MAFSFIKTAKSLAIQIFGKNFNITASHPDFSTITDAIHQKKWDQVENLVDAPKAIETFAQGMVKVEHGEVAYDGMKTEGGVVGRKILELKAAGLPFEPLAKFLDKVKSNPAPWAIDEIWLFMQSGRLPLCNDGDFLAFKRVRADYTDGYTGRISNTVGTIVEMEREKVDPVRDRTCSYGLHFCTRGYLGEHIGGENIMAVKINPADVVSIPSGYKNTKGRCCRYQVVGQVGREIADEEMNLLIHNVWPAGPPEPPRAADTQEPVEELTTNMVWKVDIRGTNEQGVEEIVIQYVSPDEYEEEDDVEYGWFEGLDYDSDLCKWFSDIEAADNCSIHSIEQIPNPALEQTEVVGLDEEPTEEQELQDVLDDEFTGDPDSQLSMPGTDHLLPTGDVEVVPGDQDPDGGTVIAQVVTTAVDEPPPATPDELLVDHPDEGPWGVVTAVDPEPRWWLIHYTDGNKGLRTTRALYPTKADVILAIVEGKIRFRQGFTSWCDIQPTDPPPARPDHASGKGMTLEQRKARAEQKAAAKAMARGGKPLNKKVQAAQHSQSMAQLKSLTTAPRAKKAKAKK